MRSATIVFDEITVNRQASFAFDTWHANAAATGVERGAAKSNKSVEAASGVFCNRWLSDFAGNRYSN